MANKVEHLHEIKGRFAVRVTVPAPLRGIVFAGGPGSELREWLGSDRESLATRNFDRAWAEERRLSHLHRLISAAANLELAATKMETGGEEKDWPKMIYECSDYLSERRHFLPILLRPYIRIDQMLPNQKAGKAPNLEQHARDRRAAQEAARGRA